MENEVILFIISNEYQYQCHCGEHKKCPFMFNVHAFNHNKVYLYCCFGYCVDPGLDPIIFTVKQNKNCRL